MTQHGYEQLLVSRKNLDYSWKKQPAIGYDISLLDHEEIWQTVKKGVKNKRIPSDALDESMEEILANRFDLLLDDGSLKNAAVVLFAKKIQSTYLQCLIKMGRFKGNNDLGDFVDNQQFYGNAFQILAAADNFVTKHLAVASFFDENSFERRDEPTVPVLALREAFINAICHRSYADRSASIYLSIFDDHLDIWNNGTLPEQLKIADLKKSHKSYPRNELISKIFFNRGLVESWGKGTNRMINLCKDHDLPDPEFKEYSGGFEVSFKFREPIGVQKSFVDVSKHQLTPRQSSILKLLVSGVGMTLNEIVEQLKDAPAPRTVRDDLAYLKKLKLIILKGFGRGAKWYSLERGGNKAVIRRMCCVCQYFCVRFACFSTPLLSFVRQM
jgi:ATP-dependent DNA helicase RecG